MNTELIFCPACNNKLRVPADLMGQRVECPKCGKEFHAPPPPGDGRYVADAPPWPAAPADDPDWPRSRQVGDWDEPERDRSRGPSVVPPSVCLMIAAVLGLLSSLLRFGLAFADPQVLQQLAANGPFGAVPPGFDLKPIFLILGSVFLFVSLATLAGSIAMIQRRAHWLAVLGSAAAMINLSDFCCVLGIPFGIWALVVLFNPDVKASFR